MPLAVRLPHRICVFEADASMAGEPWNRVNIPFPSVVSSVRAHFTTQTATNVETLMTENAKVLKLIRSEILQTEVRVLYELLYNRNNSFRSNRTLKALKQVEQCVNRLKNMKLDVALQDLADLCPNRIQRQLSIKAEECVVPSQPMLEWICLKVLGAAQLMSCTLNRCSKAFILSKQQMKCEEFITLNVVITSMLSRLWVIFRGILVGLASLYQQLLELLKDVGLAQPMPFLTDFSLPADIDQFLGPSDAYLLSKHPAHRKGRQEKKQTLKKVPVKAQKRKMKEDLGTAVKRGTVHDADIKPVFKLFGNFVEGTSVPKQMGKTDRKQKFQKQVKEAASFAHLATHLDEMILWCKSQRMGKEKVLLIFLRVKCQKMEYLEAAGYNVQGRLGAFKKEICWASSPQGSAPKTFRSLTTKGRRAHLRAHFQMCKRQFLSSTVRTAVKRKHQLGRQKGSKLSGLFVDDQQSCSTQEATHQAADSDSHDDIDDIFASVGL